MVVAAVVVFLLGLADGGARLREVDGAAQDDILRVEPLHECDIAGAGKVHVSPLDGDAIEALQERDRASGSVNPARTHREDVVARKTLEQCRACEVVVHCDVHARAVDFGTELLAGVEQDM